MIEIKNLTKTYGTKQTITVLNNVSFQIPNNTTVAITGKSGSGKSTLIHAMSGLDSPQAGEILVDDINILTLKKKQMDAFRASAMSFVFQSFFVEDSETCYDNVAVRLEIANIPEREHRQRIELALEQVGLADKTRVIARNLSGGQKQRLAIARAIVNAPKILFADEPTGNLDTTTSTAIEDLLFTLRAKQKAILIIVTHDEALAAKCDMQVHIKDGKVESISHAVKGRQ